ncbi:MAG: beta-propeller domain-containing protein, partial [Thermoleophilia bacterium]
RIRVLGKVTAEGGLVAARRTGTGLRLVVSSAADPVDLTAPETATTRGLRAARGANRRALAATTASDWLPRLTVRRRATGATVRRVIAGCRAVSRPRVYSGLGMVTVLTLATDRGLTVTDSDAVLTDGHVVYASPRSLYLATPRWVDPAVASGEAPRGTTLIHRFDTRSATSTEHSGSAGVPGYTLNQFSLSEHEGHLRVATTQEPDWWEAPADGETSQSFVTVLSTAGGRLRETGRVGGLGRNERIYAVRFLGDRGYVVTFRQTDPLYSLDLSDPAAPRVTGELKINGYSAYLHPVDDGTLIGIGQDATDEGRILGTQVSLFDVRDPANPARIAQKRLGAGYSEAENNHLAVLYWPATRTLVIPLESWGGPEGLEAPFTGAVALGVSREDGVRDIGRIAHGPGAPIRRAVVVGDDLYTLSALGLKRNALADLTERGFVPFS